MPSGGNEVEILTIKVQIPVNSSKEWTTELKTKYWSEITKHRKDDPFIEPIEVLKERVKKFKEWIKSRPETYFLVFSHADFLQEFIGGKYLDNTELATVYL